MLYLSLLHVQTLVHSQEIQDVWLFVWWIEECFLEHCVNLLRYSISCVAFRGKTPSLRFVLIIFDVWKRWGWAETSVESVLLGFEVIGLLCDQESWLGPVNELAQVFHVSFLGIGTKEEPRRGAPRWWTLYYGLAWLFLARFFAHLSAAGPLLVLSLLSDGPLAGHLVSFVWSVFLVDRAPHLYGWRYYLHFA